MRQQNKLFGHIIRADDSDIMKKPAFDERLGQPHQWIRRVGKPRMGWVEENCKYAMRTHKEIGLQENNERHILQIKELANNHMLGKPP